MNKSDYERLAAHELHEAAPLTIDDSEFARLQRENAELRAQVAFEHDQRIKRHEAWLEETAKRQYWETRARELERKQHADSSDPQASEAGEG